MPRRQEDDKISVFPYEYRIPVEEVSGLQRSRTATHAIGFPLFLFCLFVAGYFIVKQKPLASTRRDPAESAAAVAASAPVSLPPSEAEDLARRLENAVGNLIKTSEEINRSQAWIWPQIDECRKSCRLFSSAASDWRAVPNLREV